MFRLQNSSNRCNRRATILRVCGREIRLFVGMFEQKLGESEDCTGWKDNGRFNDRG